MSTSLSKLAGSKFTVRNLRGRDVYDRLKGRADTEVVSVLAALAEQQYAIDKGMGEIVVMIDQMAKINVGMVAVAENMKKVIEAHRRPDDDIGADSHES